MYPVHDRGNRVLPREEHTCLHSGSRKQWLIARTSWSRARYYLSLSGGYSLLQALSHEHTEDAGAPPLPGIRRTTASL